MTNVNAEEWWVTTGPLDGAGEKIAGPFPTRDDALNARAPLEARDHTDQYWVDEA